MANGNNDESCDDSASDVILVDEVKNKGGAINRNKAKSVGQVDYAFNLRRRQGKSPSTFRKAISEEGRLNEVQAEELEKRLKALAAAFSARTIKTKKRIEQPPTPSSEESETEDSKAGEPTLLDRLRQLASPDASEFGNIRRKSLSEKVKGKFTKNLNLLYAVFSCNYILDPQSSVYVCWLSVVGIVFLYNAWMIPLRIVFPYQTANNVKIWIVFDCLADLVYLMDLLVFKPHVKFIQSGFWVKEPRETLWSYLRTIQFKLDVLALLPVDIAANFFGNNYPYLRLPRFLKVQTFWELFRQLDTYLAHPHRARIFHTCLYMLYMIHMVACSYYALSTWEGIGTTTWTFDGQGNAYVRCFYFATKTATSIGKNPKPENELEYMFMTFAWLSGVFVFAILIGQIRDIIATATKSQTEYRFLTLATVSYLHRLGVPRRLQDRVKLWLEYTWEQQKTLDETRILNLLPKNMKAEIALNIHVETLAKVKLFQNCETAFLRDLVVKLRSIIILPGDFVCRKGEIGREMFIVKSGRIQVIGGPSGTQVLATLGEGSVFGEIALLGIGGMNKRTADVRAGGFANLFVLNKADLNDVIRDYPEAQEIMRRKAKKLMRESIKKARASPSPAATSDDCTSLAEESGIIIRNKPEPPQLISTVLKLFPPSTKIGRYLTQGSKVTSSSEDMSINSAANKLEGEAYTSFLTSYPPSPFIPTSPGHISPDMDISVMTGYSLDKMLSPPTDSQQDVSDEMTISSEDGYRSDQLDQVDKKEQQLKSNKEKESLTASGQREAWHEESISDSSMKNDEFCESDRLTKSPRQTNENAAAVESSLLPPRASRWEPRERCASPLPPFLRMKEDISGNEATKDSWRKKDVALLPKVSSAGKVDDKKLMELDDVQTRTMGHQILRSHFDFNTQTDMESSREEIPIEHRPPLYIIKPHVDFSAASTTKKTTGYSRAPAASSALIDSSLEEDLLKRSYDTNKETHATNKSEESLEEAKVSKTSVVATRALVSSKFISKMRGSLQKQLELDIESHEPETEEKADEGKQSKGNLVQGREKTEEYRLDLDSD